MVSYEARFGVGNIEPGPPAWWDMSWLPRRIRGSSKYPVIILHGANVAATPTEFYGPSWETMHKLAVVLAREGIPVIGGAMGGITYGGNTYANDAISGASPSAFVNQALTYIASISGCSSTKAHVIGVSMGAGVGLRWASLNPTKAASVVGMIPMVSIERLYKENPNLNAGTGSFPLGIATAWGLTARTVTDASITNGSPTLTSATAAFTAADTGRQLTRGYTQGGIPFDTTITYVDATTVTMSRNATLTSGGYTVTFADPLPMTGTAGADLIGVHAPRLLSNSIPHRLYAASTDAYINSGDVDATIAATGGVRINLGAGGHTPASVAVGETYGSGTDWSELVTWLKSYGA